MTDDEQQHAADSSSDGRRVLTSFFSRQAKYAVTDTPILIPTQLRRYGLSEIVNHLLALSSPVPFDFIIDGKILKTSLQQYIDANNISTESILRVEFVEASLPPKKTAVLKQDDWISSIQIHRSLPLILTGGYDTVSRIWSKSGTCIQTLSVHTAPIKCVAWIHNPSQEGSFVLSGSQDQTIAAFKVSEDGSEGSLAYQCTSHSGAVEALAVSEDAAFFASASWDETVRIWTTSVEDLDIVEETKSSKKRQKLATQKMVKKPEVILDGHVGAVTCVAFGPGGSNATVYSGGMDHSVRMWDVASQSGVSTMNCEKAVNCLSASKESGLILTGHSDNAVRLWDPRSKDGLAAKMKYTAHKNWVSCVAWSPSSGFNFASGSYDSTVKVWDVRGTNPAYSLQGADDDLKVLGLDWAGQLLVSVGEDTKMHVFDRA
eukprot:jgi/Hompol1/5356/HPOL_001471-RA